MYVSFCPWHWQRPNEGSRREVAMQAPNLLITWKFKCNPRHYLNLFSPTTCSQICQWMGWSRKWKRDIQIREWRWEQYLLISWHLYINNFLQATSFSNLLAIDCQHLHIDLISQPLPKTEANKDIMACLLDTFNSRRVMIKDTLKSVSITSDLAPSIARISSTINDKVCLFNNFFCPSKANHEVCSQRHFRGKLLISLSCQCINCSRKWTLPRMR